MYKRVEDSTVESTQFISRVNSLLPRLEGLILIGVGLYVLLKH
ncbi:hypothetical protein Desaci_1545 [Desulfosporosinus acidiphilus SJ4]|uniref:Uncharacterized protein n=1 Tax=Desulfosporosinus acidiphilus (strain DSM 22704 / JCM 16185 / SJ4) TaxID=646529 RepID=I4D426_DESAJ|nr:hypothetical protein Desaci_1545 [Desulfosporosinus acidiphilus SJ4]